MNRYQLTNFKHKIDFLISDDASTLAKSNRKKMIKCIQCKNRRRPSKEYHKICCTCYRLDKLFKSTGYKCIDDFIKYTQYNHQYRKMESVPYDQFKDIKFIAGGGFSRVYKAWIKGPRFIVNKRQWEKVNKNVALKKLNNSKNITSKE